MQCNANVILGLGLGPCMLFNFPPRLIAVFNLFVRQTVKIENNNHLLSLSAHTFYNLHFTFYTLLSG